MTLTTRHYERSHGKAPRGRGRWAFQPATHDTAFQHELIDEIYWVPQEATLTKATKIAKAYYKSAGVNAPYLAVLG